MKLFMLYISMAVLLCSCGVTRRTVDPKNIEENLKVQHDATPSKKDFTPLAPPVMKEEMPINKAINDLR